MVFCDVMFFNVFFIDIWKQCCFPETEKLKVGRLSLGGLNVAISLVLAMFLKSDVFRRCALERPWSAWVGS